MAKRNWSTISQVARLRRLDIRPVAQKAQPITHPTCEERQTVNLPGLCSGMRTVSMDSPSWVRNRSLVNRSTDEVTVFSRVSRGSSGRFERIAAVAMPRSCHTALSNSLRPMIAPNKRRRARSLKGPGVVRNSSGEVSRGSAKFTSMNNVGSVSAPDAPLPVEPDRLCALFVRRASNRRCDR